MAEVPGAPYEPYFTAQPTERPIQLRGVDAPGAAFGENIAHAVSIFGGDVEKASGEVFQRAMALRRLQVDGNIRDLTTQYYNEVAPIQEKFLAEQGTNANPDAMNAHLAGLEQVRQKYLGQAQQYGVYGADRFGNEAASLQRAFINQSTRHSAQETKQSLINTNKAALDIIDRSWIDPLDETEYDVKAAKKIDRIREIGRISGSTPPMVDDAIAQSNQALRIGQLSTISWKDPVKALELLEKHQEELGGKDGEIYGRLAAHIQQRYLTVESDRISDEIVQDAMSTGKSVEAAVAEGADKVKDIDIPGIQSHVINAIRSKMRGEKYDQDQTVNRAEQAVLNLLEPNTALWKTKAEMEAANPQMKELEETIRKTKGGEAFLLGLDKRITDGWLRAHTPEMTTNYHYLRGLSESLDPTLQAEFLNKGAFADYLLKEGDWKELIRRRRFLLEHPERENRLVQYAQSLANKRAGDVMSELDISRLATDKSNEEIYHRWTGALSVAIEEWMNAHEHKRPSDTEIMDEIIHPLIKERVEGGWTPWKIFGTTRGAFDIDIPSDKLEEWKAVEAKRLRDTYGDTDPQISDEQAYQAATRAYWQKLYAGKGKTSGGRPPIPE